MMETPSSSAGSNADPVATLPTAASASSNGHGSKNDEACSSGGTTDWNRVEIAKSTMETAKNQLKSGSVTEDLIDMMDQACRILQKELGDMQKDTVDALYHYGSALLEKYQNGSAPITSKAPEAAAQVVAKSNAESTGELSQTDPEKTANDENNVPDENDEDSDDDSNQSEAGSLPGDADDATDEAVNNPDNSSGNAPETSEEPLVPEEDDSTALDGVAIGELRDAWEILETVRVGYDKLIKENGGSRDDKFRLSEIHYKLAMCAAENGQENWALMEAERSVKICEDACGTDLTNRLLAETYFNYGSMLSMYGQLADAAENMKKAVKILEERKVCNEKKLQDLEVDALENSLEIDALKQEVKELNMLIPDLMNRVQETYEDMQFGTEQAKTMLEDWLKGVSDKCHDDAGIPKEPMPVNDISSLVRKAPRPAEKRPLELQEEEQSKKFRSTESGEANNAEKQDTNGTASQEHSMQF